MSDNSIIYPFYEAFQKKDANTMRSFYHKDATFEDPAFGKLHSAQVKSMWSMLIERGGKDFKLEFEITREDENSAEAVWQAWYVFSKTKRPVHNIIKASFKFKDGKIIEHIDQFNFWRWSRMALGVPGILLGWTPIIKNKVAAESLKMLSKFMDKNDLD